MPRHKTELAVALVVLTFIASSLCDDVSVEKEEAVAVNKTSEDKDVWFMSLAWNLLGYATIIIPAAIVIRFVKNSAWKDRLKGGGQSHVFHCIQLCIFGTPEDAPSLEEGPTKPPPVVDKPEAPTTVTAAKLIFCVAGLQISYLTWGVLQERVMTQGYDTVTEDGKNISVKFKDSQFIVFMNRILALVVAGVYIMLTRQPRHTAPLYKYSYSSFSNIMSSWCQYEALKYVSFPTQVLCKASKVIPVMLMGKIVSRKTYPYHEYVVAVLLSAGVSLFLLSAKTSKSSVETTFAGAIILIGYMAFDSFTSNWQSEMFTQYKMSSMQMMFGANIFSVLFTVGSLLQTGGFFTSISFMMTHYLFCYHVLLLSITSATGQLFIFHTINQFGPLVFTIIMTTRQVLSILLSCIIYNHPLAFQAIIGVSIVFLALFLRIYTRYRISRAKNSGNKAISKV